MTRQLETLRCQIRRFHERKRKPLKWREICECLHILTPDGKPDTGMAQMLAYGRKVTNVNGKRIPYEPAEIETLKRLDLPVKCPTCKRAIREKKAEVEKPLNAVDWFWATLTPAQKRLAKQYISERSFPTSDKFDQKIHDYIFQGV